MSPGDQRRARLSIQLSDGQGRPVAVSGLARWLARVAPRAARGIVGVALVSDAQIRNLNRQYRGKDSATDVLSFSYGLTPARSVTGARGWARHARGAPDPPSFLGDIVIGRGVARRQARDAGHDEATELRVLALHGLLHLLGYDHERDNGTMARLERRLRRRGRLREGLLERGTRRQGP
jgi:probable rRNA maturation factor